ncbi:MAG: betaine--homocysteine S-methyltransferase [Gammaproteobacteria bacterium]|nr:betaine--homocysteine S-methyltransferase [Gammaproteobacteria bacterium]
MSRFDQLLTEKAFLLADGATGTNLFDMGLQTGDAPEPWNLAHPGRIEKLHQGFIDAGSDIILTNSFGGNFHRLKLHGHESQVRELNEAAAAIARRIAGKAAKPVVVAGSMGPTGELFAPLGALTPESATAVFTEQALALEAGGADVLWIETLSSKEEVEAALTGASATQLPVVCTLSFDTNGSTMMGLSPGDFARLSHSLTIKPHAYGANCGLGPAETVCGILNLAAAARHGDILVAKGNCGIPKYADGVISYAGEPELMARYACIAFDAGARVIGGCCGTTFDHVRAMREALDTHIRSASRPDAATVVAELGEISEGARCQLEGKLNADTIAVGASTMGASTVGARRRPARGRRRRAP